jgi:hypothetical protein
VNICVFVGPTLRREEVATACDAICLPPVAQGDVYRVAQQNPRAIGIIDGYFNGAPSVWHKEILWALSQGIQVFGSASMGALRAAELHSFGMHGVGRIFEAFRDGVLEDDDEVAVVHGPAETGFAALSEPMVNIRATLERAEADGLLSAFARHALETFAKSLFFPRRSWPAILGSGSAHGVSEAELRELGTWLPRGRIDQKREDALAMLAAMKQAVAEPDPPRPNFEFEWTHFWDEMVARLSIDPSASGTSSTVPQRGVLEELRLEGPKSYAQAKAQALLRLFAGLEAKRRGLEPSLEAGRAVLGRMRAALGLFTRAELDAWLARNHLDVASFERLIEDHARSEAVAGLPGPSLDRHLLDELRLSGAYERLAERAQQKREALAAHGLDGVEGVASGPNAAALRLWFFEQRLGRPMPDDIEAFAHELGFVNLAEFDGALRREWLYLNLDLNLGRKS